MDTAIRFSVSNRSIYLLGGVLTVDQGVCRWRFKNREIGDVFNYCGRTRRDAAKRATALDSAHQIGLCTSLEGSSQPVESLRQGVVKNSEIGRDFHDISTTRCATLQPIAPFDSARQIGLSTLSGSVLTVDEGVCGWGFKFAEFWTFLIIAEGLREIPQNGRQHWVQRIG